MPLLTQHKVKVLVTNDSSPISVADWDKFSGGDLTHSVSKVRVTAGGKKQVLTGDSEVDNIVTEAFIDAAAHSAFLKALKDGSKFDGTSITVKFIDNAGVQVGDTMVWTNCSVAKFSPPQADSNGEDAAKLVIEWAVGD
jgi:hypothetical protein